MDNDVNPKNPKDKSKRDFVVLTASSLAAVGAVCSVLPLVDSLNPSSDTLALSTIDVDLSNVKPGQTITVKWRGKPIFIRNRTPEEVQSAKETPMSSLVDPQTDQARVKPGHENWLVTVGICTHLGCVPLDQKGDYNGWFCPCHGSHYDISGRIRKGPAPTNLAIPPYEFTGDNTIRIG